MPSRQWLALTSILLIAGAASVAVPLALSVTAGEVVQSRCDSSFKSFSLPTRRFSVRGALSGCHHLSGASAFNRRTQRSSLEHSKVHAQSNQRLQVRFGSPLPEIQLISCFLALRPQIRRRLEDHSAVGELVVEPHGLAETEAGAGDGAGESRICLQLSRFAANLRTKISGLRQRERRTDSSS